MSKWPYKGDAQIGKEMQSEIRCSGAGGIVSPAIL
jgi:hypothetical protein